MAGRLQDDVRFAEEADSQNGQASLELMNTNKILLLPKFQTTNK